MLFKCLIFSERWYIQQVKVSEGAWSPSMFVCQCHQWLLSSPTQKAEFPVTGKLANVNYNNDTS